MGTFAGVLLESQRHRRRAVSAVATISLIAAGVGFLGVGPASASAGQVVSDLSGTTTANDLANALVGSGIAVSNVAYTGAPRAAGTFSGMPQFGFASGIVLSSGNAADIVGPNDSDGKSGDFNGPGDADLDGLTQSTTKDASVLKFDFVPTTSQINFDYVFSSEEYNEYTNSQFNDVFGFFVNGKNCALTPDGDPVSINTINGGNPLGTNAHHPELFRNNDDAAIDIQADGLTVVLTCQANVTANATNTLKLAIADTSDTVLDSGVMLQAGSFQANNPPVASNGSVSTAQNTPVGVSLSATDADGDALTYAVGSGPSHGTLLGTGASRTYTPAEGYSGPDSFTFTANDGQATSNTATVSITVTAAPPVNHAPVASNGSVSTAQNTPVGVSLSATDADGDALTYAVGSGPSHGTLSGTGASRTYTPAEGYSGPDSFTFTANDGQATSNTGTVSITVTAAPPVNHAPVASNGSVSSVQNTPVGVSLSATDADGDALTYAVGSGPSHGTLSGTGASRTYAPTEGYSGPDSFTFTANDGQATSNIATVSITVTAVTSGHSVMGTGSLTPVSGGKSTTFSLSVSATGSTVSGSALATTPKGAFKSTGVTSLVVNGKVGTITAKGTWKGLTGYTMTVTATDGTPDRVKIVIKKGTTQVFSVTNALKTGTLVVL